jgi:hypothetical protein
VNTDVDADIDVAEVPSLLGFGYIYRGVYISDQSLIRGLGNLVDVQILPPAFVYGFRVKIIINVSADICHGVDGRATQYDRIPISLDRVGVTATAA